MGRDRNQVSIHPRACTLGKQDKGRCTPLYGKFSKAKRYNVIKSCAQSIVLEKQG